MFAAVVATGLTASEPSAKDAVTSVAPLPTPAVAAEMSVGDGVQEAVVEAGAAPLEPPVSAKILRYANRLISRYDTDRDSQLQNGEWKAMRGEPHLADLDGNEVITLDEMARRIADYGFRRKIRLIPKSLETPPPSPAPALLQPITSPATDKNVADAMPREEPAAAPSTPIITEQAPAKRDFRPGQRFYVAPRHRVQGLPAWFINRDTNGDQQLSVAEFAPKATQSDMKEFARHDKNGDGVITAKECAGKSASSPSSPPPTASGGQKPSQ